MKYSLYYFTGTGNTARAIEVIRSELEQAGHQLHSTLITPATTAPEPSSYDVLLFAFPAYSWAPAVLVQNFIRRLKVNKTTQGPTLNQAETFDHSHVPTTDQTQPHSSGVVRRPKAAVCVVDGGGSFQCADQAQRMLTRRGFEVVLTSRAGYADNWLQMTNPPSVDKARTENTVGDTQVREFARLLLNGERSYYHTGLLNTIWSNTVALIFKLFGRRMMATFFFADQDCISCSMCAEVCPVGAIEMKPAPTNLNTTQRPDKSNPKLLPYWRTSCESCNRCINICPVNAINTSIVRIINSYLLIGLAIWGFLEAWSFAAVKLPAELSLLPGMGIVQTLIKSGLIFCAIRVGTELNGPLARLLERIPGVRRLMAITFNKGFNRYTADNFNPRQHV